MSALLIAGDAETYALLAAMLASENYSLQHALDGEEALAKVLAAPFDLLITDVRLPAMDGFALLRRVRAERASTKVVLMTGESSPATVIGAIREQAYSYLGKPLTRANVIETVRAALNTQVEPGDIEVISARPNWISLRLRCKLATADRLAQFFREIAMDLSVEERDSVSTGFRELLMNAIEHGGKSNPQKKVHMSYVRTTRSIVFYIHDPGEGFSIEDLPHAAVSNSPELPFEHTEVRRRMGIRPGGFGILLTKNFADELVYSEKGNEVLLIKYLD